MKFLAALSVLVIFTAGCFGGNPAPTPPQNGGNAPPRQRTATPVPASDEEAIRQLMNAECEAVVQQDIDRLQSMWANNGTIIDALHTKDNPSDDSTWTNWTALRDYYVNIVFPSNPTFCEHPNIQVTVNGNNATATNSVKIGVTNCDNCNAWVFTKGNDGWRIVSLTFNLNTQ